MAGKCNAPAKSGTVHSRLIAVVLPLAFVGCCGEQPAGRSVADGGGLVCGSGYDGNSSARAGRDWSRVTVPRSLTDVEQVYCYLNVFPTGGERDSSLVVSLDVIGILPPNIDCNYTVSYFQVNEAYSHPTGQYTCHTPVHRHAISDSPVNLRLFKSSASPPITPEHLSVSVASAHAVGICELRGRPSEAMNGSYLFAADPAEEALVRAERRCSPTSNYTVAVANTGSWPLVMTVVDAPSVGACRAACVGDCAGGGLLRKHDRFFISGNAAIAYSVPEGPCEPALYRGFIAQLSRASMSLPNGTVVAQLSSKAADSALTATEEATSGSPNYPLSTTADSSPSSYITSSSVEIATAAAPTATLLGFLTSSNSLQPTAATPERSSSRADFSLSTMVARLAPLSTEPASATTIPQSPTLTSTPAFISNTVGVQSNLNANQSSETSVVTMSKSPYDPDVSGEFSETLSSSSYATNSTAALATLSKPNGDMSFITTADELQSSTSESTFSRAASAPPAFSSISLSDSSSETTTVGKSSRGTGTLSATSSLLSYAEISAMATNASPLGSVNDENRTTAMLKLNVAAAEVSAAVTSVTPADWRPGWVGVSEDAIITIASAFATALLLMLTALVATAIVRKKNRRRNISSGRSHSWN